MKYEIRFTAQFKKDLKLAKKQGKDTDELFTVIEKLSNGEALEAKYRDHSLSGNYKGCREAIRNYSKESRSAAQSSVIDDFATLLFV